MSIKVPKGVRIYFGNKEILCKPNCEKINSLFSALIAKSIDMYRFEREDFDQTCVGAVNKLAGRVLLLKDWVRKDFKDQFNRQLQDRIYSFKTVKPVEDIDDIKQYFLKNTRKLTKKEDMPENSDLSIMKALSLHSCEDKKIIVSEDEHFWGYKDLLDRDYGFLAVEEWNCHLIQIS